MRRIAFAAAAAALLCAVPAEASLVRLSVENRLDRFSLLVPSTHRDLRYVIKSDGARRLADIWTRRLTFGPGPPDGARSMRIQQRWDRPDGTRSLFQDSWFEPGTFRPLTHVRRTEQGGKTTVWGFRFTDGKVTGMTALAANERAGFNMPQSEAHFSLEQDMEFLQALPLGPGREFDIPFYDAGIDKQPGRYIFKVAGSARIKGPDGRDVDCWVVTADYNSGKIISRFWFSKEARC